MAGIIFPTDLQQVKPQDETLLLGADANNIARNIKASELVDYVKSNVPLDELAETISEQQATISEQQAAASEQVRTIARLVATQSAPALEAELAAGKTDLASAITAKGVETAPTDSLATMADKVTQIQTQEITIDGGELYGGQISGSLQPPKYWDLYAVLMQLLSDGRLSQYGGILLAEYYRGYDSLALSGAGAGGGYVVSDKNADGQFIMYTEDIVHTWNTAFDGYGNRWVAYCFATEYHDFEITDTDTSPRSIFIGRKVGNINSLVSNRTSEVVVSDGNELLYFDAAAGNNFGKTTVFRNTKNIQFMPKSTVENFYAEGIETVNRTIIKTPSNQISMRSIILKVGNQPVPIMGQGAIIGDSNSRNLTANFIYVEGITELKDGEARLVRATSSNRIIIKGFKSYTYDRTYLFQYCNFDRLEMLSLEESRGIFTYSCKILSLFLGYEENDKSKSVVLKATEGKTDCVDIELKDGYCKNLSVSNFTSQLTEENMYAHILQRLKQDEPDCGDGVTITLGSTNLAKLTSEESQALLAELRGTYGYTFA